MYSEQFGMLLRQGVNSIRAEKGYEVRKVHEILSEAVYRTGSTIYYWRKGHIPASEEDVEILARKIFELGRVDDSWLYRFLNTAKHPNAEALYNEILDSQTEKESFLGKHNLPGRDYMELIGRDDIVTEVKNALLDKNSAISVISIDGQGGIGKTAIALEVAYQLLDSFSRVVWIRSLRKLSGERPHLGVPMTFESILNNIGKQQGITDFPAKSLDDKQELIQNILNNRRILIVLDNMETSLEDPNYIVAHLIPLLGKSKLLLTTRRRLQARIVNFNLLGLNDNWIEKFAQQEWLTRYRERIQTTHKNEMQKIGDITGGSPLAIQLIVGQLQKLPLDAVLKNFNNIPSLKQLRPGNEYVGFYRHVFGYSWRMLEPPEKRLLVTLTNFDLQNGGSLRDVHGTSGLDYAICVSAIEKLYEYALVEIRKASGLNAQHYYLHPLTQHFVLSDVVQLPAFFKE